jgi:hypothetical protein
MYEYQFHDLRSPWLAAFPSVHSFRSIVQDRQKAKQTIRLRHLFTSLRPRGWISSMPWVISAISGPMRSATVRNCSRSSVARIKALFPEIHGRQRIEQIVAKQRRRIAKT